MRINGLQCVTLAHGLVDEPAAAGQVVSHAYFGTPAVLQDLKQMRGWQQGLVTLQQGRCIVRDPLSGRVCGLRQDQAAAPCPKQKAVPQPQPQPAMAQQL